MLKLYEQVDELHIAMRRGIKLKLPKLVKLCSLCDGTGINKYSSFENCSSCKHEKLYWSGSGFVMDISMYYGKSVSESVINQIYQMNKNTIEVMKQIEESK